MPDTPLSILPYPHDDTLLLDARAKTQPLLRVFCPQTRQIVLGRASKPECELVLDALRQTPVPIYRRRGGGCAVLLDPGNVIVQASSPHGGLGDLKTRFDTFTAWMIAGLAEIGFAGLVSRGISDLCLGENKVGGSALYMSKDVLYYSISLLVAPDIASINNYLAHPPREPDYRRGRSHAEFVTALEPTASPGRMQAICTQLHEVLSETIPRF